MKKGEDSREMDGSSSVTKCEDIQAALVGFMTRELGEGRSDLVREHLRRCDSCKAAAADVQATLQLLREASGARPGGPDRLTEDRRKHMRWALAHPLMDEVYRHHIFVSVLVAMLVLAVVLGVLRRMEPWRTESIEGIPVRIILETEGE